MRNALITGGSRGIGLGIVENLISNNFQVAINGVRSEQEIAPLLAKFNHSEKKAIYCQGNISIAADRQKIVQEVMDNFGPIQVLVNNAGVAPKNRKDLLEIEEGDYDFVMDINLKGTFFLSQLVAKQMIQEKNRNNEFNASIINISSISSQVASISRAEYCISKSGMSMLTKLLAVKMSEVDIPVYEVQPGVIATDMTSSVLNKYQQLIENGLTLEKRLGKPDDIGKIVNALASGQLPYATGQVITADGGLMIGRL